MATKTKTTGKRYSPEERKQIIDFVHQYNTDNGRGGATTASKKYGVSLLTIGNWMKKAGSPAKPGKKIKPAAADAAKEAAPSNGAAPTPAKPTKPAKAAKPAKAPKAAKPANAPTGKRKAGRPKKALASAPAPAAVGGNGKLAGLVNELVGLDRTISVKRQELAALEGRFQKLKASL